MALEIIGAGLPRTGTHSLKIALETLGLGPVEHTADVSASPERREEWRAELAGGGSPDWDRLFAGRRGAVGFPACVFWRELADHFPDARVILTIRNPVFWLRSFRASLLPLLSGSRPIDDPGVEEIVRWMGERWLGETPLDDPDALKRAFTGHNRRVQRTIGRDRLLFFDVAHGWPPLCHFLAVPVPDRPFPGAEK